MPVKTFRITNAGPFDDITFEFDERVNVFVGPNNSGKSTALLALARRRYFLLSSRRKFLKRCQQQCNGKFTLADGQGFEGMLS